MLKKLFFPKTFLFWRHKSDVKPPETENVKTFDSHSARWLYYKQMLICFPLIRSIYVQSRCALWNCPFNFSYPNLSPWTSRCKFLHNPDPFLHSKRYIDNAKFTLLIKGPLLCLRFPGNRIPDHRFVIASLQYIMDSIKQS